MNCPQCGLYLANASADPCPRCGWRPASADFPPGYTPWNTPPGVPPATGAPGQAAGSGFPPGGPDWAQTQQRGLMADLRGAQGPGGPPPMPPYGSGVPQGMPPYDQPPQPGAPVYGQYAPPSVPTYGQTYGQYPPPGYGQAAPPSMGQQPTWGTPFPPPPPPKKGSAGLIVAIVLVVVLLLGGAGGFLALRANQQNGVSASATPTATGPAPTATPSTNVVFHDTFSDSTSGWANDSHCTYASDGYHVKDGYICYSPAGNFTDAIVSADVKQTSGSVTYPYGISFRITSQSHYEFDIDSNGKWVVYKCGASDCTHLVDYTANAAIHPNLNVSNSLKVDMRGSHFIFYVNGTQVGDATDATYTSGKVGVDGGSGIEVVFASFQIATAG